MTHTEAYLKVAENFKKDGSTSYQILIEISGKYLIQNDLVEAWATLRNIKKEEITYDWKDYITLLQAQLFGMLEFAQ